MTMRGKKASTMLPEKWPDLFAIGIGQWKWSKFFLCGKSEGAFPVVRRQFSEAEAYFKKKHQPMRVALVTMFTDDTGEMKLIGR